jgi:hypothetical protein
MQTLRRKAKQDEIRQSIAIVRRLRGYAPPPRQHERESGQQVQRRRAHDHAPQPVIHRWSAWRHGSRTLA